MAKTIDDKTNEIDISLMAKLIKNFAKKNPGCLGKGKTFSRYGSQLMYNHVTSSYRSIKHLGILNMEHNEVNVAVKKAGYRITAE